MRTEAGSLRASLLAMYLLSWRTSDLQVHVAGCTKASGQSVSCTPADLVPVVSS